MVIPKVFLGIPTNWAYLHTAHVMSLLTMDTKYMFNIAKGRGGSIPAIRNGLVEYFLDTDCTHLMMCDADGIIPVDAMSQLLLANKPVIAGIHASHHEPYFKSTFDERLRPFVGRRYTDALYGITQMYATGFPAVMIQRDVFERLSFPWFELKYLTADDGCDEQDIGTQVSTDMWFAEMCYRQDVPIFVHPGVLVPHITEGVVSLKGVYQRPVFEQIPPEIIEL